MRSPAIPLALIVFTVAVVGCGGSSNKTARAGHSPTKAAPAPRYRVGQFCFANRQTQYRAGGFTCTKKHHLEKLR